MHRPSSRTGGDEIFFMFAAEIKVLALAIDKYQTIIGRPINTSAWRKPDITRLRANPCQSL
jgi:hypothetical protein